MNYVPYAAAFACGAAVGYTLGSSGDLLNNALITTSCGVSRAASTLIYSPLREPLIQKQYEIGIEFDEQKAIDVGVIENKLKAYDVFYRANHSFCLGVSLGTGASAETLTSGIFKGALVNAVGFLAEMLPVYALNKPLHFKFDYTQTT